MSRESKRKNPAREREYERLWRERNPLRAKLRQIRGNAKQHGRALELSESQIVSLVTSPCHYCGRVPQPVAGIDRVDNSIGYVPGNVVACCETCNRAKGASPTEAFEAWLAEVAAHWRG